MSAHGTSVAGACSSTARLLSRAHRRGSACRAAVAGPSPCSPETGCSGHVERRRAHAASRESTLDATVPQIMEELQERISERMHEQVVDASVPMTVHQPGDQARRVPAEPRLSTCGDADLTVQHPSLPTILFIVVDTPVVMQ